MGFKVYEDDFIQYIKSNKDRALEVTEDALSLLKEIEDFSHQGIETALRSISEKRNIGFHKVAEIIRAAIWGARVSPPMFGTMEILGKDICIARLESFKDILS
jgi:glutamyl-tRNA synthetase